MEVFLNQATISQEDLNHLRALYAENVAYADEQVGRLVEGLRERKLLDDVGIVVSSDHGEAFGDHGVILHGTELHEEQIHVPLLVRLPSRFSLTGTRWPGVVELVDLVPTLLSLLSVSPGLKVSGENLIETVRQGDPDPGVARAWLQTRDDRQSAWIEQRYKLIRRPTKDSVQLFDLREDPEESHDLAEREIQVTERLTRSVGEAAETVRDQGPAPTIPQSTREQLRALGYVDE